MGGPYESSKFALEGIAESFQKETAALGIKSMIVEPGYFRTKLLTTSNRKVFPTKHAEYEDLSKTILGRMEARSEKQPGDPQRGVDRIVDVVRQEGVAKGRGIPPKLVLGPDALQVVRKKCEETLALIKEWEDVSASTNFPDAE